MFQSICSKILTTAYARHFCDILSRFYCSCKLIAFWNQRFILAITTTCDRLATNVLFNTACTTMAAFGNAHWFATNTHQPFGNTRVYSVCTSVRSSEMLRVTPNTIKPSVRKARGISVSGCVMAAAQNCITHNG